MAVIVLLILISLTIALTFLAGFIWAVRCGQFEDTDTPSMRMLTEDSPATLKNRPVAAVATRRNLTQSKT